MDQKVSVICENLFSWSGKQNRHQVLVLDGDCSNSDFLEVARYAQKRQRDRNRNGGDQRRNENCITGCAFA